MQYCYSCMSKRTDAEICPYCGFRISSYEVLPHQLIPGTILRSLKKHISIWRVSKKSVPEKVERRICTDVPFLL